MHRKDNPTEKNSGGDQWRKNDSRAVVEVGESKRIRDVGILQLLSRAVLVALMVTILIARYHGINLTGTKI